MGFEIVAAVGVLSGIFGVIWPFIPQGRPNRVLTDIKIAPQGGEGNPTDSAGYWPMLYFWDEQNALIGWDEPYRFWGDASAVLKYTTSTYGDRVPRYIQVQGNSDNSVCVTRITYNAMDDKMGTIIGDLWEGCGQSWYRTTDQMNGIYLKCGWLGNFWRKFPYNVKLDSHFFQTGQPEHRLRELGGRICHPPFLEFTAKGVRRRRKRSLGSSNSTIVTSDLRPQDTPHLRPGYVVFSNQSAKELCESPTSFGPHFFSTTENLLCNMTTKTLLSDFYPASASKRGLKLVELGKWDGRY